MRSDDRRAMNASRDARGGLFDEFECQHKNGIWSQYRERTGVPARAARVGWWMRPGRYPRHGRFCQDSDPVATPLGTDSMTDNKLQSVTMKQTETRPLIVTRVRDQGPDTRSFDLLPTGAAQAHGVAFIP